MLLRLSLSSFSFFSILFLSSSFLISSCDALRRRFFHLTRSCHIKMVNIMALIFTVTMQCHVSYVLPFVLLLPEAVVLLLHALVSRLADVG